MSATLWRGQFRSLSADYRGTPNGNEEEFDKVKDTQFNIALIHRTRYDDSLQSIYIYTIDIPYQLPICVAFTWDRIILYAVVFIPILAPSQQSQNRDNKRSTLYLPTYMNRIYTYICSIHVDREELRNACKLKAHATLVQWQRPSRGAAHV